MLYLILAKGEWTECAGGTIGLLVEDPERETD